MQFPSRLFLSAPRCDCTGRRDSCRQIDSIRGLMGSVRMNLRGKPMLDDFAVFHSRDRDETQAWLRKVDFCVDYPARPEGRLDVRLNGIYLPGMYLGYAQYGSTVPVRWNPARDDYLVPRPPNRELHA